MNKVLIIIAASLFLGGLLYTQQSQDQFSTWKLQYNKKYSTVEEAYRYGIYQSNLDAIRIHNQNPQYTYKLGETQFMDLSDDEFVALYLSKGTEVEISGIQESTGDHPPQADWASKINPLKNQGQCGSCWTFSAVGAVEGFLIVRQNFKGVLAEQQLVDCNLEAGDGCNGGDSDLALDYITKTGLVYEKDYPYTAVQGNCRVQKGKVFINGRENLTQNEDKMKQAISEYPISVSVDATNWKLYTEGIFNGPCRDDFHNHAVVAVGYDINGNWKIRNSWGPDYGQKGHIWLATGNTCAVMTRADRAI